ncbi:MAG: riboflavin biosynthesis protein RibF, partial [Flavobacterium sp.]|nr:riboflavin biosynthesis protein RibF [Flavobacterium sp.]
HVGHQKIIRNIVQNGIDLDLETVILTFFPHPRMVLNGESDIKLLNTIDEKSKLLEKNGIQNLIIQKFDTAFSELSSESFVKNILVDQLNIQKIIIGHDHRFGKNRSANIDDLIIFGKKYNFDVEQISVQEIDDVAVSSTKIRNAIINGQIDLANDYLGYKYQLAGEVIDGKKLGRTIGFPTANINILENYKLIPKNGVYIVKSSIDNKIVIGIMNIGIKPTLNEKKISVEVYFLDFDADLYGKTLTIKLVAYIREEQKFQSLGDLKNQIETDKQFAYQFFKKNN